MKTGDEICARTATALSNSMPAHAHSPSYVVSKQARMQRSRKDSPMLLTSCCFVCSCGRVKFHPNSARYCLLLLAAADAALRAADLRVFASSTTFRRRTAAGVTSISSSAPTHLRGGGKHAHTYTHAGTSTKSGIAHAHTHTHAACTLLHGVTTHLTHLTKQALSFTQAVHAAAASHILLWNQALSNVLVA